MSCSFSAIDACSLPNVFNPGEFGEPIELKNPVKLSETILCENPNWDLFQPDSDIIIDCDLTKRMIRIIARSIIIFPDVEISAQRIETHTLHGCHKFGKIIAEVWDAWGTVIFPPQAANMDCFTSNFHETPSPLLDSNSCCKA